MEADTTVQRLLEQMMDSGMTPEEACANCQELLPRVRERWARVSAVQAHVDELFPDSDAGLTDEPRPRTDQIPQIAGYQIESTLGRGGMGVVYKARHLKLNRLVAVKMLLAGAHAGPLELARFTREAKAVAALRHENIVQVHEAGESGGCPYYTMEFVDGGTLAEQLAGEPQPPKQAAAMMAKLAAAVHVAHRGGILHRDLKPSNILLTAEGTPKISDFGVARQFEGATAITLSGARVGTPSYMPPEQSLRGVKLGPTADVYALGATLYEMLTGRPPFHGATSMETMLQAAHHEPVPPSRLVPRVHRDLDTICLKCLEKNPARRYASASDLAADLGHFLRNEPIQARPVGWAERALRWTARHRGVAAALAGVLFLLMLLLTGSIVAAAHFRAMEQTQRDTARDREDQRQRAVLAGNREAKLRMAAVAQGELLSHNLYTADMNLAGQAAQSPSGIGRVLDRLTPWGLQQPDLRGWEWYYLNGLCHRDQLTLGGHQAGVWKVAWSCDGKRLASAGADCTARIWDARDGQEVARFDFPQHLVVTLAWSPEQTRIACVTDDGKVTIVKTDDGQHLLTLGDAKPISGLDWSPDGKQLATGGKDHLVKVWNAATGAMTMVCRGHSDNVTGVAWSPDGRRLASSSEDTTARVWDPSNGKALLTLRSHINLVTCAAWSADGSKLATASNDQTVKIWDSKTGSVLQTLRGQSHAVASVAWSPDGREVVSGGGDHTVRIWSVETGNELSSFGGHVEPVTCVAWNADGKRISSASLDASVKVWNVAGGAEPRALSAFSDPLRSLQWSPDGQRMLLVSSGGGAAILDLADHAKIATLIVKRGVLQAAAWSPNGLQLASVGVDAAVQIWDRPGDKNLCSLAGAAKRSSVAWRPDGQALAAAGEQNSIVVWDARTGRLLFHCNGHQQAVYPLAFSPDGHRIASGSWDQTVRIWDATTGKQLMLLEGHRAEVASVAWSPDGRWLASGGGDQSIIVWDTLTGGRAITLRGHATRVSAVAWSPDGQRLASSGDDRFVKIWDAASGQESLTLEDHRSQVNCLAWSPDGLSLASGDNDGLLLIHDAMPGYRSARSPLYLPVLDRELSANPENAENWRFRAEIHMRREDWSAASDDLRHCLAIQSGRPWVTFGYWVAGPYPENLEEHYPPEQHLNPFHPVPPFIANSDVSANWQPVPLNNGGYVDFGRLFNGAEHTSGYALQWIYCERQLQLAMLVGSDDQARIWLNGRMVHERLTEGAAIRDDVAEPVRLEAGWNTLLARVSNVKGDHALYLRLSNASNDLQRAGLGPLKGD